MNKLPLYMCINKPFAGKSKITLNAQFVLLLVCLLSWGCSKKQVEVQVEAPQAITGLIKDIETNHPDCTCHPYISQYIWRNENAYVLAYDDQLNIGFICDWIPTYYNANGDIFTVQTGYTYDKFLKDSRLIR